MHKKDFEVIARVLFLARQANKSVVKTHSKFKAQEKLVDGIILSIAQGYVVALESRYPNFDSKKFLKAIIN